VVIEAPPPPLTGAQELEARGHGAWRYTLFPSSFSRVEGERRVFAPPAPYHDELWDWGWNLKRGEAPERAFFAIWPRAWAKTTNAEALTIATGARQTRRFALYVKATQRQANQSLAAISTKLESSLLRSFYPELGTPMRGQRSRQRGWTQEFLWTRSGFKVEALGMDAAIRGVKIDDDRPDFIILDDIDDKHDSILTLERKRDTLTHDILLAGAPGELAVLWVQNLIHRSSLLNEHVRGVADYLMGAYKSGPHPAVKGLRVESVDHPTLGKRWRIAEGTVTWDGMDIPRIETLINDGGGLSAFLAECQHEISDTSDLVYNNFDRTRHAFKPLEGVIDPDGYPPFIGYAVGIDFGGPNPFGHYTTALLGGLTRDNRIIRIREWYGRGPTALDELVQHIAMWRQRFRGQEWRGRYDGSQMAFAALVPQLGFECLPAYRAPGSVLMGINAVARRLEGTGGDPGSFYDPRHIERWAWEMERYRWMPPRFEGAPVQREPIEVDDDLIDADRYLHEAIDATPGPRGGRIVTAAGGGPLPQNAA